MKFIIITLFPNFINSFKNQGIIKKAIDNNIIDINIFDIKKYGNNKIDDKQYGGGKGMIIKPNPLYNCIKEAKFLLKFNCKVLYLTPKGKILNTSFIKNKLLNKNIIIICGRYKDIDERIILTEVDEEISIGDYVLSNGDLPSMILIDSIVRLLPGVISNSYKTDSFYNESNLLGYPCYTKPFIFNNIKVPEILLSGNHKLIYKWRLIKSIEKTMLNRPELINFNKFNDLEKKIFYNFIKNNN
ncbi:tRNA (guanosine(37)-N1)-methyltransferase TrmD [Candidatus Nardonella dryophthoridicola]|uniref:tRNA (guanosine(37)-N1)-methyltransferase TrmD n=1 Tax=Candidatus Nardonella dryophthoridicola TaxID=1971485 RepID=UPI001AD85E84|nr:tRNA (guanosine(37)-N1)-methyltransferase TrmD [Candidatus Nardonella dryophthoridicola]QTJ62892.1 tRNA (guanosine(37)-N1)-methyltransferase TrmD [Candidatus Nardonella dryophthoridicola]